MVKTPGYTFILAALIAALVAVGTLCPTPSQAAETSVAWTAPLYPDGTPVTDLAGYKIYIGNATGSYQQSVDVGNRTSYLLSGLSDGETYYLSVTGYDTAGVESGFSNEIVKSFPAPAASYQITATCGSGGTITAINNTSTNQAYSGTTTVTTVTVAGGASQSFSIAAAPGYRTAGVVVDGTSIGAVASYSFTNVTSNHTISATFTPVSYTITASAGTGGSIAPSGSLTVPSGSDQSYAIAPAAGYRIADVKVDGASVGAVASYTFGNVTANHSIAASFAAMSYPISASADANGTISPAGTSYVEWGKSQSYTIAPAPGYHVATVTVDGVSIGSATSYVFSNVTAPHTIKASFSANSYTITASAGTGGSISPSGSSAVSYGGSQQYTVTPSANYSIANVVVDGVSVGAVSSYSFSNVATNHTIAATFAASYLLANGGFESGSLSGWQNGAGMTVSSQASYSGSFGVKMAGSGRIDQTFNTVAGKTYYVSARVRIDQQTVAPRRGGLAVQIFDSNAKQLAASPYLTAANSPLGAWTQVRFSFVATTPQTRLVFQDVGKGQFAASADDFAVSTLASP